MRLASWNVAGKIDGPRAARLSAQAQAIASEGPDVVALQEVTRVSDPQWRAALARLGLPHVMSTTCLLGPDRRYANLLAARWPLQPLTSRPDPDNDFPEKLLTPRVQPPSAIPVDVHVFHAPTGVGSGWGKVRALEGLHRRITEPSATPRIVCDASTLRSSTRREDR
jgi:endonuclease/exonuclease/phosphatase family metal-dependent hydrolase